MIDPLSEGKLFLQTKDYRSAVQTFKRLSLSDNASSEVYYYLSLAYMKLAQAESSPEVFKLSEFAARKSISQSPLNDKYHDQLIALSHRLGRLDSLSREYSLKNAETKNKFYRNQLKKIAAIGYSIIPEAADRKKRSNFLIKFLNYIIMPVFIVTGFLGLINDSLKPAVIPLFTIVVVYILIRIIRRPKSKIPKGWL